MMPRYSAQTLDSERRTGATREEGGRNRHIEKTIQHLLEREQGWSDVHIRQGHPIHYRDQAMDIIPVEPEGAQTAVTEQMVEDFMDSRNVFRDTEGGWRRELQKGGGNLDLAVVVGTARFRVNLFRHNGGHYGLVMRLINEMIPSIDTLGLPEQVVEKILGLRSGIVLITGETGSGKTTTLAAVIQRLNQTKSKHILTLEDPVEFRFVPDKAVITQREIGEGKDARTFAGALRAALRQDPDIIMVGEMRDRETTSIALEAAQTGHLVLATMHTRSAADTIERFVAIFETEAQNHVRHSLASVLRIVISQSLIPTVDRKRALACEIMTGYKGVPPLIREGKTQQLNNVISQSKEYGMILLNNWLRDLVQAGRITQESALAHAYDVDNLKEVLGIRGGIL